MELIKESVIAKINHYLYNSSLIRNVVRDIRLELEAHVSGGDSHATISDPTAVEAIRRAMPLTKIRIYHGQTEEIIEQPEQWLKVIDETFSLYKGLLAGHCMQARYVKHLKPEEIMSSHGISKSTYYTWRDDFLRDGALIAISKGLVKLDIGQKQGYKKVLDKKG